MQGTSSHTLYCVVGQVATRVCTVARKPHCPCIDALTTVSLIISYIYISRWHASCSLLRPCSCASLSATQQVRRGHLKISTDEMNREPLAFIEISSDFAGYCCTLVLPQACLCCMMLCSSHKS